MMYSLFVSVPLTIFVHILGTQIYVRLLVCSFAFRTFVRFVLVWFYRFPLPLGVWKGLRFVIVALPGLFSYLFFLLMVYTQVTINHCFCLFWTYFDTYYRLSNDCPFENLMKVSARFTIGLRRQIKTGLLTRLYQPKLRSLAHFKSLLYVHRS